MNTDQSIIKRYTDKAKFAYEQSNKYYHTARPELARLWETLAAYYQIVAYDTEPYTLMALFDSYDDFEALVKHIDLLIDESLPRNISKRSMGGFGYRGDTPIGETWAIVYSIAPNVAEIYQGSNWDCFIAKLNEIDPDSEFYTIERFGSWMTPTENLMVKMITDNGKPTPAAIKVCELLDRL